MSAENLKVLVITVSAWSEKTGSNTMSSLFQWSKSENLANIYMRADLPTYKGCDHYFQITENRVIKSILKRSIKTGKEVTACDSEPDSEYVIEKNRYNRFKQKRPWALLYAREILWWLGRWKSPELIEFLDSFAPDVVMFSYEGYIYYNRLVRFVLKHTGAKAVGYIWDDNFTYKQSKNIFHNIYRFFQRKDLKKTAKLTHSCFAISPKTKQEADEFFGLDCRILTKPINFEGKQYTPSSLHTPIRMLYTGNLGIGRLDTLKVVSDALDKVNLEEQKIVLDVYTNTYIPEEKLRVFGKSVNIHGAIPQSEAIEKQTQADILLFIEDIIGNNKKKARLSFSTKLTDYFASGKCIFAVADSEVAPMEYMEQNDCAITACDFGEVVEKLNYICDNPDVVFDYGERAWNLGVEKHDSKKVFERLKQTLEQACEEQFSMKVLQINSVCGSGSTGRLVAQTAQLVRENGGESYIAYGSGTCAEPNSYRINSRFQQKLSIAQTRFLGKHGFYNKHATKKLVRWIQKVDPDIIHIHNLHGHYVNVKILFDYLKKVQKPVVWSLYDCWSFTGHCAHFDFCGCNKWQTGCQNCEQKKNYPVSLVFDRSKQVYKSKKEAFIGIYNMTIVVPSKWLERKVKQSYLSGYQTKLIPSGIDLAAFKPTESDLRERYNLTDKKIVLAVASQWVKNKGIEYVNKLADMLSDDYQVVLIGSKMAEYSNYSEKVLHIPKISNIDELSKWYTTADVLIITTLQETQGLTSVEAFACGTPVVAFNAGGAPEAIDGKCGIVVEKCDVVAMKQAIEHIIENPQDFTKQSCIERSKQYDKNEKLMMYIDLYNEILGGR